jgi:replicative DNA helicase
VTGIRNVQEGLQDFVTWASDPQPRIGLGLPFFDEFTSGGLAKAECAMAMSYSSVGKTWLGLNCIVNNRDVPTFMASIEMSWRQVCSRLVAIETGVPTWDLEAALKAGGRPGQLMDTMQRFPLLVGNDASDQSVKSIGQSIEAATKRLGENIRLVIIDYLELISGNGLLGKGEQVDRAAQKVRALCKDYDCSVIVLHQVGKGSGTGGYEPLNLDDGKYGGHHPMDAVIGMYAPRLDKRLDPTERRSMRDVLYCQLLKNRNGMAEPEGKKYRLSPTTGKITPYGALVPGDGYQSDFFEGYTEPLDVDEEDPMERVFG